MKKKYPNVLDKGVYYDLYSLLLLWKNLNKLLLKDRELSLFRGLKVGEGEQKEEVTYLFFAYNTLGFCEADEGALSTLDAFFWVSKKFWARY